MSTMRPGRGEDRQFAARKMRHSTLLSVVQTLSRIMTAIFLVALVWAIYVAVVNGDPLPVWAWLGVITLLAAVIGLGVALVVYRGEAWTFSSKRASAIRSCVCHERWARTFRRKQALAS